MQKEKEWQAFIKISNLLTCATPLTEKIDTILQIIIDTIDNADAGFFLLWQEQQQHLAIKSAINFKEDYYLNDTLLSGEGISGKVFATGQPALFTTTQPMQQAMADLKTTNHDYYLASTVVHGYPKSCMSVPIFYQQAVIGVITLNNFFHDTPFNNQDVHFLTTMTSQIAVVLKMAEQFSEIQRINKVLLQTLQHTQSLNQLMLQGTGLRKIITELATHLATTIIYFDYQANFICASQSTDYSAIEHHLKTQPLTEHFTLNTTAYTLHTVSSRYGIVGYIVLVKASLTLAQEILLAHSAAIIAIEQINEQRVFEKQMDDRQQILHQLLKDGTLHPLLSEAQKKAIQQATHYFLFSYQLADPTFYQLKQLELGLQNKATLLLFPYQGHVTGLVALSERHQLAYINTLKTQLTQHNLLVGRIVQDLPSLRLSQQDINLLKMIDDPSSFRTYKELGIYRYLLQLSTAEKLYFIEETLGPILQDTKNNLVETLKVYLQQHKNVQRTAQHLHLHQNSVYYRLQKIEATLHCNLQDATDTTNLQAALFLQQLLTH